jgi:hypothetical protein
MLGTDTLEEAMSIVLNAGIRPEEIPGMLMGRGLVGKDEADFDDHPAFHEK